MKRQSFINLFWGGLAATSLMLSACTSGDDNADELLKGFVNPPQEARPRV